MFSHDWPIPPAFPEPSDAAPFAVAILAPRAWPLAACAADASPSPGAAPTTASSFWGELQRRKIVQRALLYGIVAWVVIQAADIVIPALNIPEWGVSLVVVLLAPGFRGHDPRLDVRQPGTGDQRPTPASTFATAHLSM